MHMSPGPDACPYLGRRADPETYFTYPNTQNLCHSGTHPAEVSLDYQSSTCLSGDWEACQFYPGDSQPTAAVSADPHAESRIGPRSEPALSRVPTESPSDRFRRMAAIALAAAGVMLALGLYFVVRGFVSPLTSSTLSGMEAAKTATPERITDSPAARSPTPVALASPSAPARSVDVPTVTRRPGSVPSTTPTKTWVSADTPEPSPSSTVTPTSTTTSTPTAIPSPTATPSLTFTATPELTVSPVPSPTVDAGPWSAVHVVQSGEILALVAGRYGTTAVAVASANGIDDPNLIYAGQVLTIPMLSPEAALAATPVLTGSLETLTVTQPYTLPVPALVAPADGATVSGTLELQWQWPGQLEPGHYFAVLVWWEEQQSPTYLSFTKGLILPLDLDSRVPGCYNWMVRLADVRRRGQSWILRRFLSATGDPSRLTWGGPEP